MNKYPFADYIISTVSKNKLQEKLLKTALKTPFIKVNFVIVYESEEDNLKQAIENSKSKEKNNVNFINYGTQEDNAHLQNLILDYKNKGYSKEQIINDFQKQIDFYNIEIKGLPKLIYKTWNELDEK